MYVKKADVDPAEDGIGYTEGCPGCKALMKGTDYAVGHNEGCRRRVREKVGQSHAGVARVKASRARGDEFLAIQLEESVNKAAREDTSRPQGTGQYGADAPSTQEASTSSSSTREPRGCESANVAGAGVYEKNGRGRRWCRCTEYSNNARQ